MTSLRHVTLRKQRPAHRRLTSPMTPPTIPDRSGRAPTGAEGGDTQVSITIFFMQTRTRTRTGNAHTHIHIFHTHQKTVTRSFVHTRTDARTHIQTFFQGAFVSGGEMYSQQEEKKDNNNNKKTLVRLVSQPDTSEILTSQSRQGKKNYK